MSGGEYDHGYGSSTVSIRDSGADTIDANRQLGLQVDLRNQGQCAEIVLDLGLRKIRLISNNPDKIDALKRSGLEIVERGSTEIKFHRSLTSYLKTKRERMGHFINLPEDMYERTRGHARQAVRDQGRSGKNGFG